MLLFYSYNKLHKIYNLLQTVLWSPTHVKTTFTWKDIQHQNTTWLTFTKPYWEVVILAMDWAWIGDKLDWQKLDHASCFCSSFSTKTLYIEIKTLRAASLASGSLSFNKSAPIWTKLTKPYSFISSKPWKMINNYTLYKKKKAWKKWISFTILAFTNHTILETQFEMDMAALALTLRLEWLT